MTILAVLLLLLSLVVGWIAQVVGLGGNWLIVAAAAVYVWCVPADSGAAIGWPAVAVLLGLAVAGELIELAAGALGVAHVGGSRTSAFLALVGSTIGAVVGLVVGVPIPVIGSLVAAIVFGGAGAMAGALLGESLVGRGLDESLEVGKAAFMGRVLGTLAKIVVSSVMVVVVLSALIL
ncbi:MAG TPA: DUF456 family protein [Pirellulales bacterium]|nr:DUF456 family protein [Pirellulales bacterium]